MSKIKKCILKYVWWGEMERGVLPCPYPNFDSETSSCPILITNLVNIYTPSTTKKSGYDGDNTTVFKTYCAKWMKQRREIT